jgi:hypothetical protein
MLLLLFATVAIGLGTAGLVIGIGKLTGRPVPKGAAAVAAGLAMFGFMLWNEYSWFDRAEAGLPEGAVVAETVEHSSFLQPWTLAFPRVVRFAAIDTGPGAAARAAPEREGYLRADVILAARFSETLRIPHLFDCAGGRRAALPGSEADPATLDWVQGGGQDDLIRAACQRTEAS